MFKTNADLMVEYLESKKQASVDELSNVLELSKDVILAYGQYLEEAGIVSIKLVPSPSIVFLKYPETGLAFRDERELINKIKILLEVNNLKAVNKILYELYNLTKSTKDDKLIVMYDNAYKFFYDYLKKMKIIELPKEQRDQKIMELMEMKDQYTIKFAKFLMEVRVVRQEFEAVPYYILYLLEYGRITEVILDKLKEEIVRNISMKSIPKTGDEETQIEHEFKANLLTKLMFLFPDIPEAKLVALSEYIKLTTLGMGEIEVLLRDTNIEEIVINNANEPIWIYHKKHAWLKTNIIPKNEDVIKHYASLAGRLVNRDITLLNPLLDAHLKTGDRLNATLSPVTTKGNSLTIRKFASKPWTITDLIKNKTLDEDIAALIWTAIEYELSVLIVGGTGSGKTSTLNVLSNFFSPVQRIISIEDTRELVLPDTLHWVPMETRLPNPEGMGEITMLDLAVNSLRMRPDRILVGEIRRKNEAEVLFEAMHTGHSVYGTLHANSVEEAIMRLTNPPIDISKNVLNSLSLLIVQNRNRRTGKRRTFQVAEILQTGDARLLYELDVAKDQMSMTNKPTRLFATLKQFSGLTEEEIIGSMDEKKSIIGYLVKNEINDVHQIGSIVSDYYTNKPYLLNRLFAKKDNKQDHNEHMQDQKEHRQEEHK